MEVSIKGDQTPQTMGGKDLYDAVQAAHLT